MVGLQVEGLLRLPHDLAGAVLRRHAEPRAEVRPRQRSRPARRRPLGARLRRLSPRALCAPQGQVPRGQHAAHGRHPPAARDDPRCDGGCALDGSRRHGGRSLRRAGLGRWPCLVDLAGRHLAHLRHVSGGERPRLCLPGPGPRQEGPLERLERDRDLARVGRLAQGRRLRQGGRRLPRHARLAGHLGPQGRHGGSGGAPADRRRPPHPRWLHLAQGRRSAQGVGSGRDLDTVRCLGHDLVWLTGTRQGRAGT